MDNTKDKIKTILNELYQIDPSFKAYGKDLEKLIFKLIELKPEAISDSGFKEKLMNELLIKAEELKQKKNSNVFVPSFFSHRFSYSILGALIVVILFAGSAFIAWKDGYLVFDDKQPVLNVSKSSEKAFGSLIAQNTAAGNQETSQLRQQSPVLGAGEGVGDSSAKTIAPSAVPGMGGGGTAGSVGTEMMPYRPVVYKYVYKGSSVDLTEDKIEVLRRSGFSDNLNIDLGQGLFNLGSFGNMGMQSVTLKNDNYVLYADFENGIISIQTNFNYGGDVAVMKNVYPESGPTNIPEKSEIIAIADSFIKQHGINVSGYGNPEVDNSYFGAEGSIYYPSAVVVLYPLKINGYDVNEDYGNKYGLSVNVDVVNKKVTGVWNLTSNNYDSSSYDAVKDFSQILKFVEQGGVYGGYWPAYDNNVETKEIEVGEPYRVYLSWSNWQNGKTNNLLVPALYFPVISSPNDGGYYKKGVVVPLAKEILENSNQGIYPMPLMEGVAK